MRITFSKLAFDLNPILLRPVLGLALVAAFAPACGPGSTTGTPGTAGTSAGTAGMTGSAGTTGTAGTSGSAGTTGVGGNSSGGNSAAGSSGGDATGGAGVAGSTGGATGGSGGGPAGRGGSNAGTGGNATGGTAGGAQAGRGGSSAGTGGASAGAGGRGGTGGGGGVTGTGGGAPTCPSNATFCSGFETNALPANAVYKPNAAPGDWSRDFVIDTTVKRFGNSSLRVKSGSGADTSGSAYKMLAVPGTQGAFWVRFFIRSNTDMGGDHNAFTKASDTDDPNSSLNFEFAEDVGIAFNLNDDPRWPAGYGRLTAGGTNPYVLPKDTWYCVEISYDSATRVQQLFVNGAQLINATNYPSQAPSAAIRIFKFGFQPFHGPDARSTWYDDVAVAPTRIGGCN